MPDKETRRKPPSNCLDAPFAPLQSYHLLHLRADTRLISIAQDSTLHRAATLTSHFKSTPVGFEPTRGDPIGLASRRLSRSAKVSSAQSARQLLAASRTHLPMPCHRLNLACTHSSTDSIHMHQPGIEPGSHRWRRCILPLDH